MIRFVGENERRAASEAFDPLKGIAHDQRTG